MFKSYECFVPLVGEKSIFFAILILIVRYLAKICKNRIIVFVWNQNNVITSLPYFVEERKSGKHEAESAL